MTISEIETKLKQAANSGNYCLFIEMQNKYNVAMWKNKAGKKPKKALLGGFEEISVNTNNI